MTIVPFILLSLAAAELPASIYQVMGSMKNQDVLCVKNYQAGGKLHRGLHRLRVLGEGYPRMSRAPRDQTRFNASLEARINSNVIGKARLAWQSVSPIPSENGRHVIFSRNGDSLAGAFTIQKLLQLWSNSTIGCLAAEKESVSQGINALSSKEILLHAHFWYMECCRLIIASGLEPLIWLRD